MTLAGLLDYAALLEQFAPLGVASIASVAVVCHGVDHPSRLWRSEPSRVLGIGLERRDPAIDGNVITRHQVRLLR